MWHQGSILERFCCIHGRRDWRHGRQHTVLLACTAEIAKQDYRREERRQCDTSRKWGYFLEVAGRS